MSAPADWRMFDDQQIPDALWHFQTNFYGSQLSPIAFLKEPRAITGLVNTWIWRLFGFRESAWLAVSVGLHLVNCLLVYRLFLCFPPAIAARAWIVALVFYYHPMQVSAVHLKSVRAGVQCTTFAYAALCCLALGFWPVAIVAQFLAQKSKEDAWIYLCFWPMVLHWSVVT